ncbi:MAG: RdgB/HAM1 family non-canonical purine NTP pyrophosphatase [Pseudonocardiaceae bacterium]|nr:RdgB/HAM1 family non-canonical purine NTP pyrophosphatase [Pseudonocardiaceae bacterium]
MNEFVLATRNGKKLDELRRILDAEGITGLRVLGLEELESRGVPAIPETQETEATFEGNAVAKAVDVARASGLPAVADDSGLEVDALNGMPGVLSARWAGKHGDDGANLELVLGQLSDVPDERRGAAFVCATALVTPDGTETVVRGEWRGTLTREPRGTAGFGYDPIFLPEGQSRTAAELDPQEKDADSHRGRALRLLLPGLRGARESG